MSELCLLEGENVILDVKPTPNFKKYVAVRAIVSGLVILAMFNVLISMGVYVLTGGAPNEKVGVGPLLVTYACLYFVLVVIFSALTLVLVNLMYEKYHYWVTDQRGGLEAWSDRLQHNKRPVRKDI